MTKKFERGMIITIFLLSVLAVYFGTSFVAMSFNPFDWGLELRAVSVFLCAVPALLHYILGGGNKEENLSDF